MDRWTARMANLRLLVFLAISGVAFLLFRSGPDPFLLATLPAFVILFAWLVHRHVRLDRERERTALLREVNDRGRRRLEGDWHGFEDRGEDFLDPGHPYARDLDVFGASSLFQWLCVARTWKGRRRLAELLGGEFGSVDQVRERQAAVDELAKDPRFMQALEVAGRSNPCHHDPCELQAWTRGAPRWPIPPALYGLIRGLPWIALACLLGELAWSGTAWCAGGVLVVQLLAFLGTRTRCLRLFAEFDARYRSLRPFAELLRVAQSRVFACPALSRVTALLATPEGPGAAAAVESLARTVEAAELRHNLLAHFFVNWIWSWDLRCAVRAERWRIAHGGMVEAWIDAVAELEALSSLAVPRFENPSWTFPVIDEGSVSLRLESARHPLVSAGSGVPSDLALGRERRVAIVTGSNMSGKSTFLRTVGVNAVLGGSGAPVCASRMEMDRFRIHSSMRVEDSLREEVSTFFQELRRIKGIADAVSEGIPVLFLIDEIFSGTNSRDRIAGARGVLKGLAGPESLGLVSTHDLELCELADRGDVRFANFHFREEFDGDRIVFDYVLRDGPSPTRNALHLIRLAGIRTVAEEIPPG